MRAIVGRHTTEFDQPPANAPADVAVDAPLLGNGDMGVVLAGRPEDLRFLLCKNDLWRLQTGGRGASPVCFGWLRVMRPWLPDTTYRVRQDFLTATTTGVFTAGGISVEMTARVQATTNILTIDMAVSGRSCPVAVELNTAGGRGSTTLCGSEEDVQWGERSFDHDVDIPVCVAVAWQVVEGQAGPTPGSWFLEPGFPLRVVLAMTSSFAHTSPRAYVLNEVARYRDRGVRSAVDAAHERWWSEYWQRSCVDIGGGPIERQYYRSLYGLASCSRDPDFPPPVFGWVTTDEPRWNGDYHLNYNHQAPYYGLVAANRIEQAVPHDTPYLDFMERASWHCRAIFDHDGGIFPSGIGPKGIETGYQAIVDTTVYPQALEHGGRFMGQRTNGAYGLVNMAARWYLTRDQAYARHAWPFVLQTVTFWENYLEWDEEGQRYVIEDDACHEDCGHDRNPTSSLGLVRNAFQVALDIATAIGAEGGHNERWRHILTHLSAYAVQERDGRTVFRYTERGIDWRRSNTVGIQHIYPAGQVHLDSDPELLRVARNTIAVMARWHDTNGSNSFFPAAVRVGHDAGEILVELERYVDNCSPNGFQSGNNHGIENLSTVPNTIDEMLCMGHAGVIRLFPVWPRDRDAAFERIRCWGAFLVSSRLQAGEVVTVRIESEAGETCTVVNPWPGRNVSLRRNGGPPHECNGERLTIPTAPGECLVLQPG